MASIPGKPIILSEANLARFKRLVDQVTISPTGCWLWPGKPHYGYGVFGTREGQYRAHRVSYTVHVGPVPPNLMVCHKCDIRLCINPDHMFLGTGLDNIRDCLSKGRGPERRYNPPISGHRAPRGEASPKAKMTEADVVAIRMSCGSKSDDELAVTYGVSSSSVRHARTGRSWKHIPIVAAQRVAASVEVPDGLISAKEVGRELALREGQVRYALRLLAGKVRIGSSNYWPRAAFEAFVAAGKLPRRGKWANP